ncbi:stalk domain-containing protein [Paenibacillus sp. HB172176]|uniref:stalk domain-containing protein n=1 Tax=Paenibacillus sp. HB172176 TaxID=2493690 RepID=UPI00143C69F6|nr:stalk domain-containing protein [Paenibacillus sp. HB172176]
MKFKKIAVILVLLSVWGGSMIFADAAAQKVRVMLNGVEQSGSGAMLEGKTYLPLRQLATALGAIVEWDDASKTAIVYKPNVHMFVYDDSKPFGVVNKGYSAKKLKVFSQIDNLKTDISSVKVTITDPYGSEQVIQTKSITENKDNFWFITEEMDYKFDSTGIYTIQFYMQSSDTKEWNVVSEKQISSINGK